LRRRRASKAGSTARLGQLTCLSGNESMIESMTIDVCERTMKHFQSCQSPQLLGFHSARTNWSTNAFAHRKSSMMTDV
jgi:hypothetical protein